MSRTNPFGDLDDFAPTPAAKPVPAAIDQLAETSGFPSRKAQRPAEAGAGEGAPPLARPPRRRTTGRNRQINIKATEESIERLYRIADALDLPLGAVLERALDALERETDTKG